MGDVHSFPFVRWGGWPLVFLVPHREKGGRKVPTLWGSVAGCPMGLSPLNLSHYALLPGSCDFRRFATGGSPLPAQLLQMLRSGATIDRQASTCSACFGSS